MSKNPLRRRIAAVSAAVAVPFGAAAALAPAASASTESLESLSSGSLDAGSLDFGSIIDFLPFILELIGLFG